MFGDPDPVLLQLFFLKFPKSQKTQEQNQIKLTQASATQATQPGRVTQAVQPRLTSSDHGRRWARLLWTDSVILLRKLRKVGVAIGGGGGSV